MARVSLYHRRQLAAMPSVDTGVPGSPTALPRLGGSMISSNARSILGGLARSSPSNSRQCTNSPSGRGSTSTSRKSTKSLSSQRVHCSGGGEEEARSRPVWSFQRLNSKRSPGSWTRHMTVLPDVTRRASKGETFARAADYSPNKAIERRATEGSSPASSASTTPKRPAVQGAELVGLDNLFPPTPSSMLSHKLDGAPQKGSRRPPVSRRLTSEELDDEFGSIFTRAETEGPLMFPPEKSDDDEQDSQDDQDDQDDREAQGSRDEEEDPDNFMGVKASVPLEVGAGFHRGHHERSGPHDEKDDQAADEQEAEVARM